MKEKNDFQKQVKSKAYEQASGYFTTNEESLSKSVLFYDPVGNYMSPPVTCMLGFDDFFVRTLNKKYGANYTMWAYMDDITPMKREELYSEVNRVIKLD